MLPPPLLKPRDLIDEDECEDDMDYINGYSQSIIHFWNVL